MHACMHIVNSLNTRSVWHLLLTSSVLSVTNNSVLTRADVAVHRADTWISEIRHHRHWQHVLEHICGSKLSALACKLPEHGTVMGGTMSLLGNNITLACFHGINFRSKSWALFTMDEPYICFATEAADVIDGQSLLVYLLVYFCPKMSYLLN